MTNVFGSSGPAGSGAGENAGDPAGLRAIIAIYPTALGPALGGTRFYPYPSDDAAVADVLNLARAMALQERAGRPGPWPAVQTPRTEMPLCRDPTASAWHSGPA